MSRRGPVLLLFPLALAVVAVVVTLQGFQPEPAAEGEGAAGPEPRYELADAQWTRHDPAGTPQLRATAARIEYFDDRSARLTTLTLDQLGGADGPWRIHAPSGTVPAEQMRMQIGPPVRMTGTLRQGGAVDVATERLWIDWQKREIYTDDRVTLTAPRREARARGLRTDWAGTRVRLLRDVRVDYAAPR